MYPLQHGRYEISKHYQIAEKPERSASAIIFSDNIVLGISLEHLAKLIDMDILIATMLKYIKRIFLKKRTSSYEWLDVFL